jgi:hypothetical protein
MVVHAKAFTKAPPPKVGALKKTFDENCLNFLLFHGNDFEMFFPWSLFSKGKED